VLAVVASTFGVTPNCPHGGLPEWSKGAVCKTAGSAYVGSNPTPATVSRRPDEVGRPPDDIAADEFLRVAVARVITTQLHMFDVSQIERS
jgi:hypothetical protein